ncbi:MAG TPA: methylmalonyl Co-A mutase-associated GTPase MeaB [Phycisphaerae bacterium]|nr:methylmalonyl Co-A mutase-associated GTPase MeaB [Phycisphaerae bacterium]
MNESPVRILLAKVGLDGHDRGVKVLARGLRDAGLEVIYTGLWQTPAAAAKAAIEEDVDVIGVSFHSAAHLTLVPLIMDELTRLGRRDIPVVLGGIIPKPDVPEMEKAGAAAILETEAPMEEIVRVVKEQAAKTKTARQSAHQNGTLERWIDASGRGDRIALGQVLTWIETAPSQEQIAKRLPAQGGGAIVVGVTGAPGVGKSTLIGRLLKELRSREKQVAVVAVDPASPLTGGALLGDRARMTQAAGDPGVFLRSSASRGELGGLAPTTGTMVRAIAQSKVDVLLIETVGAGQNDVTVRHWASPLVLVMMPGAGDELQLEKAGITEVADIFVINKADLPGADRLEAQIKETLGAKRPVVKTVASHGEGIGQLVDVILAHKK